MITSSDCRQDGGGAVFALQAQIDKAKTEEDNFTLEWELFEGFDQKATFLIGGREECVGNKAEIQGRLLECIRYWHFDSPNLYTLKLSLGMAEPKSSLEKMLLRLEECNRILTRFHWQQGDWVYDWCDRHGMLVQEEVPFWGANPPTASQLCF